MVPLPNWFTVPPPEIALVRVNPLVWLKLIVPVPLPKAIFPALPKEIVPAPLSLPPRLPILRTP